MIASAEFLAGADSLVDQFLIRIARMLLLSLGSANLLSHPPTRVVWRKNRCGFHGAGPPIADALNADTPVDDYGGCLCF